jgi:hypothetical protein
MIIYVIIKAWMVIVPEDLIILQVTDKLRVQLPCHAGTE